MLKTIRANKLSDCHILAWRVSELDKAPPYVHLCSSEEAPGNELFVTTSPLCQCNQLPKREKKKRLGLSDFVTTCCAVVVTSADEISADVYALSVLFCISFGRGNVKEMVLEGMATLPLSALTTCVFTSMCLRSLLLYLGFETLV